MSRDHKLSRQSLVMVILATLVFAFAANPVFSHCDSEDGPIIPLIRTSLDNGDITPLLKWLAAEDEAQIKDLFQRVRALRTQSAEAKAIADQLFIETFIRVHRAAEGAPFNGIKPAGSMPPIFGEADKALVSGNVNELAEKVTDAARESIHQKFNRAIELSKHQNESVEAGREYIEAYVIYVHFLEGLDNYLHGKAAEHHSPAVETHEH